MSFENPFSGIGDQVKKKVKNITKLASIAALGVLPMASLSAENIHAGKEPQKTEADSAREMIKVDAGGNQQGDKEYYYSYFPGLSHEKIDSLMSEAAAEEENNQSASSIEVSAVSQGQREEAAKMDTITKEILAAIGEPTSEQMVHFDPDAEIISAYKIGAFKNKKEYREWARKSFTDKYPDIVADFKDYVVELTSNSRHDELCAIIYNKYLEKYHLSLQTVKNIAKYVLNKISG